jgi:polysaccharide biosynthesis protein PslF
VTVPNRLTPCAEGWHTDAPTFGVLSTFAPTACGLATFSAALAGGFLERGANVGIVRIADGPPSRSELVVGEHRNGSSRSVARTAERLNNYQVTVVQHEYGVYGGADGDEVLAIMDGLQVPVIVIAHTVLSDPTPHQRTVLEAVCARASQVVVMSDAARRRLCERFDVDGSRVLTIAHGATVPTDLPRRTTLERPTILTSGLIGPGKGIERVIDAMRTLRNLRPQPQYLVAGQTHPKVLAADGEAYREARIEQAACNGVASSVHFDAEYRDVASLTALIQRAAVVALPYDSTDQVTSGVLVDAIAAGRPIVATAFPHAVELLGSGAGIVVDHDDPDALVQALRRVLEEPGLAIAMAAEARRIAPSVSWPGVAASYLALAKGLLTDAPVPV